MDQRRLYDLELRVAKLQALNAKLTALLEHPEPRLITWLSAVAEVVESMQLVMEGKE